VACRALYRIGACVGRGSVVGLAVGTGGEVEGESGGVTVWLDGLLFVVPPTRSVAVRGYAKAMIANATAAARTSGIIPSKAEGRRGVSGSFGLRRGSLS
jgi:hypothetical protein